MRVYASVGPQLALYDIDVEGAALSKRGTVTLPANIQYAWPHPSKHTLYVVSSNGGPGVTGDRHFANALAIDAATGMLRPSGNPAVLPSRPIHVSVDGSGGYLLTAYNDPSNVTVHRLNADGTIGAALPQPGDLDTGIYAHQVLAAPGNRAVTLVTRGNNAAPGKPEDPGAIKTFAFANGVLHNLASIAPGNGPRAGFGFGPRHLDFHPQKPWAFVSIERQNKLYVYKLDADSGLARQPMFITDTLADHRHNGSACSCAGCDPRAPQRQACVPPDRHLRRRPAKGSRTPVRLLRQIAAGDGATSALAAWRPLDPTPVRRTETHAEGSDVLGNAVGQITPIRDLIHRNQGAGGSNGRQHHRRLSAAH